MEKLLKLFIISGFFSYCVDTCPLPLKNGTWYSSTRGNWLVSSDQNTIGSFKADLSRIKTTADLECVSRTSNKYTLKTNFEIFFGVFIDVFTCVEFIELSDNNTFVYYMVTPTDPNTGEEFTSDQGSACINSNYKTAINRHVAVYALGASSAGSKCPNVILGKYIVEYLDIDSKLVEGVYLDVCNETDKKLLDFNTTGLAFTAGRTLTCLNYVTSGPYVYLHTYNHDKSVNDQTTYKFGCWVIANADNPITSGPVKATVHPSECVNSQTPTSVPYGGQEFTFTLTNASDFCGVLPETTTSFAGWKIALIVLGVIAAIIAIVGIAMAIRYACSRRQDNDEEKQIIKARGSPDSELGDDIDREKARLRRKEEGYDSGFDEHALRPRKKDEKERTFDLLEIKRPVKAQDGQPGDKDMEPKPVVQQQDEEARAPIEFPSGKKSIPPTTPRPEEEDAALARVKKERERKAREREERKKKERDVRVEQEKADEKPLDEKIDQVIKTARDSPSSEEYETDDSERAQKILQKKRRLREAAYIPPEGVPDAKVVGKKKRRKYREEGDEGSDTNKTLTTRDQQEELARHRGNRKKALKRMARKKFRSSASEAETTDSEADVRSSRRRHKRRKVGDPHVAKAPYTKQYYEKKDIERELDEIGYFDEKIQTPIFPDEEEDEEGAQKSKEPIQVAPVETAKAPDVTDKSEKPGLEKILEEEADVWASLGVSGFQIGPNGELPEGFHFDDQGNVVRDKDGKIIPKEAFDQQIDRRRRFGFIFSLPRLIRNTEGRPLGGYKDDEFGPTAEWDFGETVCANEEEDNAKKLESQKAQSERQVAFSVDSGLNTAQTPLKDIDLTQINHIKGRQLGSAERGLLKERLFDNKGKPEADLPVYFLDKKGGIKPESIYIENAQIARQDPSGMRKVNTAPALKQSMVMRSDTFDDGRSSRIRRNSRLRSSWNGKDDFIPEEIELQKGMQGISRGKRNIGSDDEFIVIGGSMKKLDTKPHSQIPAAEKHDSHSVSHWSTVYERQGHLSTGEPARDLSEVESVGMRTATDTYRPTSGADRKMRKLLQELYTDKKYFDHYLDSETLQTNAGTATRGLVSHGLDFLKKRADYWAEHQPVNPPPPPSELALRLTRMHTFYTVADSGMQSMLSSARPFSADDAQDGSRRATRENSVIIPPLELDRAKTAEPATRDPPTGRSVLAPSPSHVEKVHKEKTVTIDETPREHGKENIKPKANTADKQRPRNKPSSEELYLPGNVLSITETDT